MASKTWKLGEVCKGGVITVECSKTKATIIGKEWDSSKGFNKGSDQSKAKEWTRLSVNLEDRDADRQLTLFLDELTTSYYCGQIMEWIESKSELKKRLFW